ncbi:unnamed protein product [Citrullus colocynthis]|uniref:Uncharacterized protein n=1 Tax=Citrullus colocynthis TaxID=252529 RepID=A0ABP0YQS6_9ROSI
MFIDGSPKYSLVASHVDVEQSESRSKHPSNRNDDNVETSFVNISSVYGLEYVDKIAIVSCGVELSKTHVGVMSDKRSSNVECDLSNPLESYEKSNKGASLKTIDKRENDLVKENVPVKVVPEVDYAKEVLEAQIEVPGPDDLDNKASSQANTLSQEDVEEGTHVSPVSPSHALTSQEMLVRLCLHMMM